MRVSHLGGRVPRFWRWLAQHFTAFGWMDSPALGISDVHEAARRIPMIGERRRALLRVLAPPLPSTRRVLGRFDSLQRHHTYHRLPTAAMKSEQPLRCCGGGPTRARANVSIRLPSSPAQWTAVRRCAGLEAARSRPPRRRRSLTATGCQKQRKASRRSFGSGAAYPVHVSREVFPAFRAHCASFVPKVDSAGSHDTTTAAATWPLAATW